MFPSPTDPLFGIFVKNFKNELEKQGVAFPHPVLIEGKAHSTLKKAIRYSLHYLSSVFRYFTARYDLVYVHYLSHHIPVLLLMAVLKRKPVVVNVHGTDIIALQHNKTLNYLARFILKRIRLLVVPTSYFRALVLDNYPFIRSENLFISPSGGINGNKFYNKDTSKSKPLLTLGFISRFIEEKGWKVFLNALVMLKQKAIPFRAFIAGKGPDEKAIEEYIKSEDLEENVQMLGLVKQEELVDVYNQLQLYIFPTYREAESLGLTGLEAMSCGVPVIASDLAGPSTYITEGVNGFLCPPRNAEKLCEKIIKFHSLPEAEKNLLSANALATASEYEQSEVARKLIRCLMSL